MILNTSGKYKNLNIFDDQYFVQLIQCHILEYQAHFAERLISIYVWGSVHRNEAIQGVDTIPLLRASYPQWTDFLNETRELYIHLARSSNERVSRYLSQLVKWMDWIEKQLK